MQAAFEVGSGIPAFPLSIPLSSSECEAEPAAGAGGRRRGATFEVGSASGVPAFPLSIPLSSSECEAEPAAGAGGRRRGDKAAFEVGSASGVPAFPLSIPLSTSECEPVAEGRRRGARRLLAVRRVPLAEQLQRAGEHVLLPLQLSQAAPERMESRRLVLQAVRQPQLCKPQALQQHVVREQDDEARRLDL